MNFLEISQIILNITVSLVILFVGTLMIVIFWQILVMIRAVKQLAQNIQEGSKQFQEQVNRFLENISFLPFISRFFSTKKTEKKK